MSSELDDIMKELRAYQRDIDEAIGFLSKEYPNQSKERNSVNRLNCISGQGPKRNVLLSRKGL
jgi:hypothetical protein